MAYARPRRRVSRPKSSARRASPSRGRRSSPRRASTRRADSPRSMTVKVVVQSQNAPTAAGVTAQALRNARF